jgi:hypothetical protein
MRRRPHHPGRGASGPPDAGHVRGPGAGQVDTPAGGKRSRSAGLIVPALLAALAVQGVLTMRDKSVTYDEPFYTSAGYVYLTRGRFELNREHPPLMKYLIGIPLLFQNSRPPEELADWAHAPQRRMAFGSEFLFENRPDPDTLLFWARVPTVAVSLLLALFVWLWTRQLYGAGAAAVALLFYCFDPNIVTHSSLATLDLGITAATFVACFCLWRLYRQPSLGRVAAAGLALAAALLMKYSAVVFAGLIPVFLLGAILHHRRSGPAPASIPSRQAQRSGVAGLPTMGTHRLIGATVGVLAAAALVIACAYGFGRFGLAEYVAGFKLGVLEREKLTQSGYQSFLCGRYSATGFRAYHFVAFLLKTPIPTLLLAAATLVRLAVGRTRRGFDEMFLVAPILAFLVITMPIKQNFGLRNILPVYPFVFALAAGTLAAVWHRRTVKVLAPLLGGWYVFSAVHLQPDYLAYFNELSGGPAQGIRYLDDSNIDWGQDLKPLARYVKERNIRPLKLYFFGNYWLEPAAKYYGLHYARMDLAKEIAHPQPGWYAVSAHLLQRPQLVRGSNLRFDWLDRFQPEVVIGHSIYLYHFEAPQ